MINGGQFLSLHWLVHSILFVQTPSHHPQPIKRGACIHAAHVSRCVQPGPLEDTVTTYTHTDTQRQCYKHVRTQLQDETLYRGQEETQDKMHYTVSRPLSRYGAKSGRNKTSKNLNQIKKHAFLIFTDMFVKLISQRLKKKKTVNI